MQSETGTKLNLSRSGERNLIRNSGQYWKGPGLLEPINGRIELTDLGQQVAEGRTTGVEFALTVATTLTLPNPHIDSPSEIAQWEAANLKIKPLELILSIVGQLEQTAGDTQAYLTAHELIRIVIPLAGVHTSVEDCADALLAQRAGLLDVSGWPDCAPAANDKRVAHEFLLFLWHHGLCRAEENPEATRYEVKFFLTSPEIGDSDQWQQIAAPDADALTALKNVRLSNLPATVEEERRVMRVSRARPGQVKFRREVLKAYGATCLLTGEKIADALEAAHIIGKEQSGADTVNNGFCLRADIHNLFDAGHIRVEPSGQLHFSDAMQSSVSYGDLPSAVQIPGFVTPSAVEWRWRYQ